MVGETRTSVRWGWYLGATALVVGGVAASVPRPGPDVREAVRGTVTFSGAAPPGVPADMSANAYCQQANAATPYVDRPVAVGGEGGLANAIVYVRSGLPADAGATPETPVVLDQENCVYRPRVLALQAGQPLVVRNSDATLHNVHVYAEVNRGFNLGQPLRGVESRRRFDQPELPIAVQCDVHPWMHGFIGVFDHPYFAVTDSTGAFDLGELPAGDYVIAVWHEQLGEQTVDVTVGSTAVNLDITFPGG